ncbi:hypothetical protein Hypma_010599 [Hypsizygus marmoreus]|uniref:Uncharacterized protein n=1 Tax=Hypsizygus marmoreus TaxID=39966 RepID=A0A369JNY1_HYPMA|nr:hypothetical protein Hypma_010599 [Hypsizygus marmoreus]
MLSRDDADQISAQKKSLPFFRNWSIVKKLDLLFTELPQSITLTVSLLVRQALTAGKETAATYYKYRSMVLYSLELHPFVEFRHRP